MVDHRRCISSFLIVVLLVLLIAPAALADAGCWTCVDRGGGAPDPCRNTLYDVDIVPGTGGAEAWAVGDRGTILRYHNGSWTKVASPTTERLYAVAAANTSLALATGMNGAAVKWDGSSWTLLSGYNNGGDYIRSVAFVPGTNGAQGWASGDGPGGIGKFLYWDGDSLESKYHNNTLFHYGSCYDMDLLDANNGFAANQYIDDGNVYRWDGDWWNMTQVHEEDFWGIAAVSSSDVWAVGDDGGIFHYDGAAWGERGLDGFSEDLYDVDMTAGDFGWAVGEAGATLRWDGSTWTDVYSGMYAYNLRAVTFENASFGWAVGEGGIIARWDGSAWQQDVVPSDRDLEGLAVVPGSGGRDVWAVGSGGTTLRWNGSTWYEVPGPSGVSGYYGVGALNGSDAWATGWGGKMCHWDGASWSVHADIDSLKGIHMIAWNDVWGLGFSRLRHYDGSTWNEVENPNDISIYGSHMVAPDDIWAVGTTRKIARYDGSTWQDVPHGQDLGYNSVLWDVGMASGSSEGYVGGSSGKLLKWNGSSWSTLDFLSDGYYTMRNVDVVSSSAGVVGWVIADDGKALRIENGAITQAALPTGNMIWDLTHVSPYEAWAVGDFGVILHWTSNDIPGQDPRFYLPILLR